MNLLFDIGGTRSRFALSNGDELQNIQVYKSIQNYNDALKFIEEHKDEITKGNKIESVSGGIAGLVKDNQLHKAPHLDLWAQKPIKEDFLGVFKAKNFSLKNDASLAALAEANLGNGRNFDIVAYITIGTGVGGARVIEGQLDKTTYGFEPGHIILNIVPKIKTLEDYISGSAIELDNGQRASQIKESSFWEAMEVKIAYGLNNIALLWSPDVVILGGGIINSNLINLDKVSEHMAKLNKILPEIPLLSKTELGDSVGLYGAMLNLKSIKSN